MVLPRRTQSRPRQAVETVSDLLIVTAVIWALPVTLGVINAGITLLVARM